ncbi:MAG: hypothetical protein M0Z50_01020 [Planctomycetia bacterium]|nr:hypothetical protein [Planctomycetia bacterium]
MLDTLLKSLIMNSMETQPQHAIFTRAASLRRLVPVLAGSFIFFLLMLILHPGHPCTPLGLLVALTILFAGGLGLILQWASWLDAFLDRWINSLLHGANVLYVSPERPRSLRWFFQISLSIPAESLKITYSQPKNAQAPNPKTA